MEQLKGFTVPGEEGKVCKLLKALYGLKQAGRQWHAHLHNTLQELGFMKNISNNVSIFIKRHEGGDPIIILVYVNDIAIFGKSDTISEVKTQIAAHYKTTDLGEINHFLGIHITRDHLKKTLYIDQMHYIKRMLTRYDMEQCLPMYTPFAASTILAANREPESDTALTSRYQQIVSSLMYVMLGSRPDICFAVNKLSQYGLKPTEWHLIAAQQVLRYLSTTCNSKLCYGKNDSTELIAYSDSDWASDPDNRHSMTGYTFILSGGAIAWATQKQRTVVLSSTEAEYMAITECAKHAQWTISLLRQLNFDIDLPLDPHCDLCGARAISINNVFHKRTKHIDIRYHYIRDVINAGTVEVIEVSTKRNVTDFLTKSLPRQQHENLSRKIRLTDDPIEGECCERSGTLV